MLGLLTSLGGFGGIVTSLVQPIGGWLADSFLDALQHMLDAAPLLTAATPERRELKRLYLLTLSN
jgi:hypothetical protein